MIKVPLAGPIDAGGRPPRARAKGMAIVKTMSKTRKCFALFLFMVISSQHRNFGEQHITCQVLRHPSGARFKGRNSMNVLRVMKAISRFYDAAWPGEIQALQIPRCKRSARSMNRAQSP